MPCIQILLNFQNEIRLHHWGTTSYSAHVALGALYEGLDPLLDAFTEAYIGVNGREEVFQISSLTFNGPKRTTADFVLKSFEEYLSKEMEKEKTTNYTSLLNIRDEMLALVQKTRYLLTLS
jgi:hypothetical protein